jgi:NAD+ synthase (glutamine-hydrolysing)
MNASVGGFDSNIAKIGQFIDRARTEAAHIVTFPELALCGYPPEDLLLKRRFLKDNRVALEKAAAKCSGIIALIGFADHCGDRIFNAAALVKDREIVEVYHKIELPNYGVFDEKRYFDEGDHGSVIEIRDHRISLTICEDVWIRESRTLDIANAAEATAIINIAASPFHAGKLTTRLNILRSFISGRRATILFNNLVGGQDDLIFDGGSLVMGPDGEVLAQAERFVEDMLVYDMPAFRPGRSRRIDSPSSCKINIQSFPEADQDLTQPPLRIKSAPELTKVEEIHLALVLGVHDYVVKNGFEKVVIGLSGGIDSSLTAAIAAHALGKENVIGVTMPSQHTSGETLSDAEKIAENLGIRIITTPIRPIYESYISSLKEAFGPGELGVEAENIQARIRGNILMALSNRFGWLTLTTGNKSETAVGYCTLYGDMAGGFAVIKDVPKTIVYEVARLINEKSDREIIPVSTILRAPSAELRPDQKDEDSLPPYETLDPVLQAYVEEDMSVEEIVELGYREDMVREVARMVDINEYKRRQAPPGIKITPKAFGRDRRLPITNRYSRSFIP